MHRFIPLVLMLPLVLSGCLGMGALATLSAVGSGVVIAKDVFGIGVDIHTILEPLKPTPTENASLRGK